MKGRSVPSWRSTAYWSAVSARTPFGVAADEMVLLGGPGARIFVRFALAIAAMPLRVIRRVSILHLAGLQISGTVSRVHFACTYEMRASYKGRSKLLSTHGTRSRRLTRAQKAGRELSRIAG